jgi:hypothetical protein
VCALDLCIDDLDPDGRFDPSTYARCWALHNKVQTHTQTDRQTADWQIDERTHRQATDRQDRQTDRLVVVMQNNGGTDKQLVVLWLGYRQLIVVQYTSCEARRQRGVSYWYSAMKIENTV